MPLDQVGQPLGQSRFGQLQAGDVDPELTLGLTRRQCPPARRLTGTRLEHPPADQRHQPGRRGHRQELTWQEHPPLEVTPAQQRLHADDGTAGEVDLRLQLEYQASVVDGALEVVNEIYIEL